jgi:hypothetical protein
MPVTSQNSVPPRLLRNKLVKGVDPACPCVCIRSNFVRNNKSKHVGVDSERIFVCYEADCVWNVEHVLSSL